MDSADYQKLIDYDIEKLPIGAKICLDEDTVEGRLAKMQFRRYLFAYFEELSSGYCGWGVDFIGWLSGSKGWEHLPGLGKDGKISKPCFERIMSVAELDAKWREMEEAE